MKPVEIEFLMKGNLGRGLDDARRKAESLDSVLRNVGAAVGIAFGTRQAMEFARKVMDVRGEVESLQISFETLAGKAKGRKLFGDIREWVVNTPMMMQPVAKGAQTLLGFNIEAEKVMPILRQIGDISMGDAQKFNSLTLAFAQMSSTGKLMGQDLLQMINAGFNPLVVISEKTGKSMATLKKEMADGRITVKMVEEAFASATAEGGRFHGMLEKQSKGIKGAMSNLQGAWDDMLNDIGEKSQGEMVNAINQATELVKDYDKVLDVLEEIVVAYGSYKAALMLVVAAQKAMALAENIRLVMMFRKEMGLLTAAQQAFNRAALVNPYVLIGVAAAGAGVAAYNLAKADNAAEAAQKKLNQTVEEANQLAKDHQRELDELTRKATSEAASTDDRRTAMQQLVDKYPNIIQKYIDEKGHLTDIINLKREIARLDGQEKAGQLEEQTRKAKRYLELYDKSRKGIQLSDGERKLLNNLADEVWDQQSWWTQTKSGSRGNFVADYYQGMLPSLERSSARTKTENMLREYNNGLEKMTDDELVKMSKDAQDALRKIGDKNSAFLDSYTHDYVTRGDLGERLGIIGNILEQRHPKKNDGGGSGSGKTDKLLKEQREQAARAIEEERRMQENISKIKRDAEDARTAATIAAIPNDAARERAERKAEHDKTIRDIEAQEADIFKDIYEQRKTAYENANKGKHYELTEQGQLYGKDAIYKTLIEKEKAYVEERMKILWGALKKEDAEYERYLNGLDDKDKEAIRNFLSQWGSYEQKKQVIEERAAEEEAKIRGELGENATEQEKAAIEARVQGVKNEAKQKIDELNKQYGKAARVLGDLFADASKKSIEQIDKIVEKYEALLKMREGKEGYDKKRLIDEFGFTEEELTEIEEGFENGSLSVKEFMDRLMQLKGKLKELSRTEVFKNLFEEMEDAFNKDDYGQGLTKFGNLLKETSTLAGEFGESLGTIFHFDKSEYEDLQNALNNMGSIFQGIGQIYSGDYIGGAVNTASGIAGMYDIVSGAAFEREGEQHLREILSDRLSALNDSVQRLTNKLDEVYGEEAVLASKEARQKALERKEYATQVLRDSNLFKNDWGLPFGGKAQLAYYINEAYGYGHDTEGLYAERMKEFREAGFTGPALDFLSQDDWEQMLAGLSDEELAELLKDIKENHEDWWAELINLDDGFGEEYLNAIVEAEEQLEEIERKTKEAITRTSFDSVFDSFMSSLEDLANGSEDVFEDIADNWQKMVNKMVLYNLVGNKYKKQLEDWYDMWEKAYSDDSEISEDEIIDLKKKYNDIVEAAMDEVEALRENGLIAATGENAGQSQTAKTGGFSAMSQDQGTKLDGMFTAGLQHWSSMDKELTNVSDRLGTALDRLKRIEENTEYCRKLDVIAEDISHIKSNGVKIR